MIIVSAGPSRERFDDVRFLSNGSTGAMGIEVARALGEVGFEVELLLGPSHLSPPDNVVVHRFESADDLESIAAARWPEAVGFVATAAVCDYRPADRLRGKRKKEPGDWDVKLVRNPDVIANRSRDKGDRVTVGFALESLEDAAASVAEARRKLESKCLDVIILNGPANMGSARGDFDWIEATGAHVPLPGAAKRDIARRIAEFFVERFAQRL